MLLRYRRPNRTARAGRLAVLRVEELEPRQVLAGRDAGALRRPGGLPSSRGREPADQPDHDPRHHAGPAHDPRPQLTPGTRPVERRRPVHQPRHADRRDREPGRPGARDYAGATARQQPDRRAGGVAQPGEPTAADPGGGDEPAAARPAHLHGVAARPDVVPRRRTQRVFPGGARGTAARHPAADANPFGGQLPARWARNEPGGVGAARPSRARRRSRASHARRRPNRSSSNRRRRSRTSGDANLQGNARERPTDLQRNQNYSPHLERDAPLPWYQHPVVLAAEFALVTGAAGLGVYLVHRYKTRNRSAPGGITQPTPTA